MSRCYTGSQLFRKDLRKLLVKAFPEYNVYVREGKTHYQTAIGARRKADGVWIDHLSEEFENFKQKADELGKTIHRLVDLPARVRL